MPKLVEFHREKEQSPPLLWVPDHVASKGNEEADKLARKGAAAPLVGSEPFCGSRDMFLKGEIETLKNDNDV